MRRKNEEDGRGGSIDYITLLGFLAGFLTTVAFVPQLLKAWKSKSTKDISLGTFLLFVAGVSLWLAYGILIGNWPITVNNVVTLAIAAGILGLKLKYK